MERAQDIATGFALSALGVAAAIVASGYPGAGGRYPAALGAVLALLGSGVALRAVFVAHDVARPLADNPARLVVTIAMMVAYLALVPALGFFTASTLLMVALPVALGLRRAFLLVATTVIFIAIVYVLFTLVLARPLPTEFWQAS